GDPLLAIVSQSLPPHVYGLAASVLGAAAGAGFIYLTGLAGKALFRKEAMGLGDVKLMALIGAFLGWRVALLSIFIGCIFGAVIGLSIMIAARKRDTRIPFGPYLSLGAISVMLFEPQVLGAINWWQKLVTSGFAGG
ncbi:MAG TPA: A24 family peptidase, partial [Planctomycetota bacterium]|nr:A24 family peptidase [Planctomycetota bacterium]